MENNKVYTTPSNSRLSRVAMLLLALYPLLAWYDISFAFPLGGTVMLFFAIIAIALTGFKFRALPRAFWVVFGYVCLVWCYRNGFGLWTLLPPGGWVFFLFCVCVLSGTVTFDLNYLSKFMKMVVWIAIPLFWIQYVLVHTSGSNICFVPNITGHFTYEGLSYGELATIHRGSLHPCSIFLEKSYMAYYLISYLTILLFRPNQTEKWWTKEALAIIVTLVFLRSGSGMVALPVLLLVKIFMSFWNEKRGRRTLLIFASIPIIAAAAYIYIGLEAGEEMLSRQSELTTEGSSGYSRVVAGYMMFETQGAQEQMWGSTRDQLVNDYGHNKEGNMSLYINGFQTILLSFGYIGTLLYLFFYVFTFRRSAALGRMSIIMLLVMSLLESNYLNAYMVLFTVIPCAEYYIKNTAKTS